MRKFVFFLATHAAAVALGFALGVYFLPILTAPSGPDATELAAVTAQAEFMGRFERDLPGSDFLHWGEGDVAVTSQQIAHMGALSPGPDFKLYLTNAFATDEESFLAVKDQAVLVGDVKTFDGFLLEVPEGVDVAAHSVVVVWCEAFSEFITAARYK